MATGKLLIALVFPAIAGLVRTATAAEVDCSSFPFNDVVPLPHEYNCSLYYECYQGDKTLHVCPSGLWYNNSTRSCDFPQESGCTNGDQRCVGGEIDYFPESSDCNKYIECYEGDPYLMACPPGLWFDSDRKLCVPPNESDCVLTTISPPWTTPDPVCWGVRPGDTVLIRYPYDCHKYWQCKGADLTLEICDGDLYFSEDKQSCDFQDLVPCEITTLTPDPSSTTPGSTTTWIPPTESDDDPRCIKDPTDTSYWPHPVYCTKYIECFGGHSYVMNCPPDLYFSDKDKRCVDPEDSDCGKTTTSPETTTERSSDATDNPDCPYPESEGKLLPDTEDCTKYYECAEGKKVRMDCPDGLWFNPVGKYCDYPYQSGCEYHIF